MIRIPEGILEVTRDGSQKKIGRMKRYAYALLALAWLYLLLNGAGPVPRLTPFVDLHGGLWGHRTAKLQDLSLAGLKSAVTVSWDAADVPHIRAASAADLYLAQGYVMASKRLFQMDLSSRVTLGRLSEWVGQATLDRDRFFVRLNMRHAITETLKHYEEIPETREMLGSFVAGVNAYIHTLKRLPPEYALLGAKPEEFTAERVIAMAKALTWSLSGRSFAIEMSELKSKIGADKVLDLFPRFLEPKFEDYVVPSTTRGAGLGAEKASEFAPHLKHIPLLPLPNPGRGSNNWAVDAKKSTTGFSLFANDTHLSYSLPNVWFESQLTTPEFNVYGVSLVGIPGVVNGFNRDIAWGPTNGTTTVLDFYEIEFADETSTRFKREGAWTESDITHEKLRIKDAPTEEVEVVTTPLGPVIHREGRYGLVARWTGFTSGKELKALRQLYSATTYKECLSALAEGWRVPIQNFVCADREHVGIRHAGFVPKRKLGEGRFIADGSSASLSFTEPVDEADHPQLLDPPDHHVLSANQKIVGPGSNLELGWDYEEPFRGQQIRRRLTAKDKLSPEDFIAIQNDDVDRPAELALPLLLAQVSDVPETLRPVWDQLKTWDYHVRAALVAPTLFKAWFSTVQRNIFDYQLTDPTFAPKSMRAIELLERVAKNPKHPDSQYLKGSLAEEINAALKTAAEELAHRFGADPNTWTWGRYNNAGLPHIARLPGWGRVLPEMDGSGESIRGNHGRHGPTYKAVVALGPQVRAWFQVPGGTEGDPLSPGYGRDVDAWASGQMREVQFFDPADRAVMPPARVQHFDPEP